MVLVVNRVLGMLKACAIVLTGVALAADLVFLHDSNLVTQRLIQLQPYIDSLSDGSTVVDFGCNIIINGPPSMLYDKMAVLTGIQLGTISSDLAVVLGALQEEDSSTLNSQALKAEAEIEDMRLLLAASNPGIRETAESLIAVEEFIYEICVTRSIPTFRDSTAEELTNAIDILQAPSFLMQLANVSCFEVLGSAFISMLAKGAKWVLSVFSSSREHSRKEQHVYHTKTGD